MSEEEKEVIDYFENLDIDLNTLWRIDLKGLEKRRKQILELVEKQQKEIETKQETIEDLTNQIAELKDKLDTKGKVINKMATECSILTGRWENLPNKEIIEHFYKEIENE